ncbi:MAG: hypothetical protein ABI216_21655 [Devosia sp.]
MNPSPAMKLDAAGLARALWLQSAIFPDKAKQWDTPGLMLDTDKEPYFDLARVALDYLAALSAPVEVGTGWTDLAEDFSPGELPDLLLRLAIAADGIETVSLDKRSIRRGYENLLREARAMLAASPQNAGGEVGVKPTEPDWWYDPNDPEIAGEFYIVADDRPAGRPINIHGAATVRSVWWAHLLAADDADSDDEWECQADTEADCLRLIAAEIDRRSALTGASS